MKISQSYLLIALLWLSSCDLITGGGYKYNYGQFPEKVTPLEGFNSKYDDYNATAPTIGAYGPIMFSSTRRSLGSNFDFVVAGLSISFDKTTGELEVHHDYLSKTPSSWFFLLNHATDITQTDGNELGPNLLSLGGFRPDSNNFFVYIENFLLLYASDASGDLDIMFTHNQDTDYYHVPRPVSFLNSEFDDAYPAWDSNSNFYFTSNRGGQFDIYKTDMEIHSADLISELQRLDSGAIVKVNALSSVSDDKCPFVIGDVMVFTSDRPGGYGGFDLYYSLYENGEWGEPVNFGEKINTKYDEYRPIIKAFYEFKNHMMIFSSNRPEGLGGFDLYYVGVAFDATINLY